MYYNSSHTLQVQTKETTLAGHIGAILRDDGVRLAGLALLAGFTLGLAILDRIA